MKKKKLISLLLCVVTVLSVALSGCAGKDESSDNNGSSKADEKEAEGIPDDTLVYWTGYESSSPQGKAIKAAAEQYTNETQIQVKVEYKGEDAMEKGLAGELDAGSHIDLFDGDLYTLNHDWSDYLADLESMAKEKKYEKSANELMMTASRDAGGGVLKSIPFQSTITGFFYNKAIFEAAGVTAVPATWEEFLNACEMIKAAGYIPITSDDEDFQYMMEYHLERLAGEEKAESILTDGKWDDEAVLQFAQVYADLAAKGYFSERIASNKTPAGKNAEFALGDAAMYLGSSVLPGELKSLAGNDFQWGFFAYPELTAAEEGADPAPETKSAIVGGKALGINKNSKLLKEAFGLIQYMTTGELDLRMSKDGLSIPADINNIEWPEQLIDVKTVFDEVTNPLTEKAKRSEKLDTAINENFGKLCDGSIDPQSFVDALVSAQKNDED